MNEIIDKLRNKIIVSVQAQDNEPLNKPEHLLAVSLSAISGGAAGLRLCGIRNINHIKKHVSVPVIGLTKTEPTPINYLDTVYITPSMQALKELIKTEADCIAIDGTSRVRADKSTLKDQIDFLKSNRKKVLADVATFEEGMKAAEVGADLVSTTLSGYTRETRHKINEGPDFKMLRGLCVESPVPVILEGRVWNPEEVKTAFEAGAFAVIIGTAITRPQMITRRFVSMSPEE